MRAMLFESFQGPLTVTQVVDPTPSRRGAVLEVLATGICRSDWHAWQGHDDCVRLPHVPGHELAGIIREVGPDVSRWREGARVTVPFVCACGSCEFCAVGDQQVCPQQTQPGFTHWGSFAEYVSIDHADVNLVAIPESVDSVTAASLGCRFATAFRAIIDQGQVRPEQWVAIHGCGGVGLSAIMIARSQGARVIAIDIMPDRLHKAAELGAEICLNGRDIVDIAAAIREVTSGGAHLSMDALGSTATCLQSLHCLRKRGKHLQVGLMLGTHAAPSLPLGRLIGDELEILGCHGMPAHRYPAMLALIESGLLAPQRLIEQTISLTAAVTALPNLNHFTGHGVTIINRFD